MTDKINRGRRRFLGAAATMTAAAPLALIRFAEAQPTNIRPAAAPGIAVGSHTSFGVLKRIDAGVLNIGYADVGPAGGPPVLLLHGWPYDIHSFIDVAPLLAAKGYRVLVPYLRGYGATRFLSTDTARNGQQVALAADCVAFMDALRLEQAILAGFDWGARTVNIVAALWPTRCKAMVSVSGYLIGSREANRMPLPPRAELEWWYQDLLRDGPRSCGVRQISQRVCEAHLAARLPAVALRRRHVRSQREGVRQPGSCERGDSQLPLAARARRGRIKIRRSRTAPSRQARSSRRRPSRSKAMPMERHIPIQPRMRKGSPAGTPTGS